jgi:hypothetical protein
VEGGLLLVLDEQIGNPQIIKHVVIERDIICSVTVRQPVVNPALSHEDADGIFLKYSRVIRSLMNPGITKIFVNIFE